MNIYDLAKEAGVSIATASKALNGRRDVNAMTRARVLDVAKRMDYHPSHMARGLARRRTENIGVVAQRRFRTPFFSNPFHSQVMDGMEQEVAARGYNLLLCVLPTEEPGESGVQLPKLVREKNADGLVLLGDMPQALIREVFERRIPCVVVDTHKPALQAHYVVTDHRGGMRDLVGHMAGLGHRNLAFVQAPAPDWGFAERQAGFEAACAERSLRAGIWPAPKDGWAAVDRAIQAKLMERDRPTAVLAANDELAFAVLRAAKALGLGVPRELSVAGFDDLEAAAQCEPGLSTLRVDSLRLGRRAIQEVFRLMEPPVEPESVDSLQGELIVRGSTGPVPKTAVSMAI